MRLDKYAPKRAQILRLPIELLLIITEFYCGEHVCNVTGGTIMALVIAHVSHTLRCVSFASKRVWSHIKVDLEASKLSSGVNLIGLCLDLSSDEPLGLEVHNGFNEDNPFHRRIMFDLTTHASRWKAASIHTSALPYVGSLKPSFQMLDYLELMDNDDYEDMPLEEFGDCFVQAPQLRKLTIESIHIPGLLMPWSRVTEINLALDIIDFAFDVLEQCICLDTCILTDLGYEEFRDYSSLLPPRSSPVVSLTLCGELGGTMLEMLFSSFCFPKLREIYISGNRSIWEQNAGMFWPHDSFINMICRSKCSIEVFILFQVLISDQQLLESIDLMPNLSMLNINEPRRRIQDERGIPRFLHHQIITKVFVDRFRCHALDTVGEGKSRARCMAKMLDSLQVTVWRDLAPECLPCMFYSRVTTDCTDGCHRLQKRWCSLQELFCEPVAVA